MTRTLFGLAFVIVVFCLALTTTDAQAIMLGAYDFENATGLASVDSDANSSAGLIISGVGITAGNNLSRGETNIAPFVVGTNDQSLGFSQADAATADAATARAAGDFFSFTVSANPGYRLNLEDLTFRSAISNIVLDRTWTLDYAIDGGSFVNDFATGDFDGPQTTSTNTPVWTPFTVNFGDTEFDSISSISLRFVQNGDFNTTHAVFFDKITLNGLSEVAPVPEPSTALLLAIGMLVPVLRRKR